MYYQPRIQDKDGKIKSAVAALEAATGLRKSVIVAQLLKAGIKNASKASPKLEDIIKKED
jgi:chaperone required for assembly of F1-ATPase